MNLLNRFTLFVFLLFKSQQLFSQSDTILNKQEKGYFNLTEGGYYYGLNDRRTQIGPNSFRSTAATVNAISLRNINGFFVNNHLSLGVGVGLDGFQIKDGDFYNTFQVFGDVRYYFKNAENTWYAYGNLGRAMVIDDGFEKGLSGGGGIGVKFMISYKTVTTLSFGYNEQEIKTNPQDKQRIPSFAFRVGLLF